MEAMKTDYTADPRAREIAAALHAVIARAEPMLRSLHDTAAAAKPQPEKWSPKEILGHLIDSAGNNQQKFVRAMAARPHLDFTGYEQDAWVAAQHYQQAGWPDLIDLWAAFNRHLAHVIGHTAPECLGNTVSINGAGPFTLGFIMADYVEHLKHHLFQIFPDGPFTSRFSNVYNA